MATSAVGSHGTLLKVGDGTTPTEAFTTIAEVKDIDGPAMTLNMEDATSHDSGGWREEIATLLEAGDVTFDINYIGAATQVLLETAQYSRERLNFQLVFPMTPAVTKAFSGYVTSFGFSAAVSGILTASVTIRVSGAVTSVP